MRDHDHRLCAADEELFQPLHRLDVHMVGRFVEQDEVGFLKQDLGQFDAHAPAPAEFAGWPVEIGAQEAKPDETARGMTLNQQRDTSRIGGGIGDIIEQSVAKPACDWLVQLYHVFYDEKHFGAVLGSGAATQYVELQAQDIDQQLIVGITANSMQPKDQISEGNQAMSLYSAGAIGPKTLLETLNFPDPDDAAEDGVLWKYSEAADGGMSYITLNYPQLAAKLQQMQQQQQMAQQQAQQAQMQQEAQGVQQKQQQSAQAAQQGLQQKESAHQQQMAHGEQQHQQKLAQSKEMASAALAAKTQGTAAK